MICVFGDFGYWNDGRCWSAFSERGDEKSVVTDCAERWAKYQEGFIIEESVGIDLECIRTKVSQVYDWLVSENNLKEEISKLKAFMAHSQKWLDEMETEKQKHLSNIIRYKNRLEELE